MNLRTGFAALICVAAAGIRTAAELYAADPATGFPSRLEGLFTAEAVLYFAGIAAVILLEALDDSYLEVRFYRREGPLGLLLALSGAGFALMVVLEVLGAVRNGNPLGSASLAASVLYTVAAVPMLYCGFGLFRSGNYWGGMGISLLPAAAFTGEAARLFLTRPSLSTIPDERLTVCALCAGALFWVYHAHAHAADPGVLHRTRMFGLIFSILALPVSIGQLSATVAGLERGVRMDPVFDAALLLSGLYAFLWSACVREYSWGAAARLEQEELRRFGGKRIGWKRL